MIPECGNHIIITKINEIAVWHMGSRLEIWRSGDEIVRLAHDNISVALFINGMACPCIKNYSKEELYNLQWRNVV